MTRLLYVPLAPDLLAALDARAAANRRRPGDEAALVLEWALGVLSEDSRVAMTRELVARGRVRDGELGDEGILV